MSLAASLRSRFWNAIVPKIARTPEDIALMLRHAGFTVDSGAEVTSETAMRNAAVYACVRVLSDSVGMLPLRLYQKNGEDTKLADKHPVDLLLRSKPNPWQTAFEFKRMMLGHVALRGNAYAKIDRIGEKIAMLLPLDPARMAPEQLADLKVDYRYRLANGTERVFKQSDILHIRGLSSDGVLGLSPIAAAAQAIGLALQAEKFGAKLFANAARPSGVLKHPGNISEEAAARLKKRMDEQHGGADNAAKTLVLEEGMAWEKVSITPDEAQFIDSRKLQRSEIAMFFGVPPHMIGDIERGTSWGSGIEQQGLGFVTYTLLPWLTNFSQAVERDCLTDNERRTMYAEFDTEVLTQADFKTRQEGRAIQAANGIISPNEWRRKEKLNPRADGGGNEYTKGGATPKPAPEKPAEGEEERADAA